MSKIKFSLLDLVCILAIVVTFEAAWLYSLAMKAGVR